MSFCLIILAGGNSHRFKSKISKPYQKIGGKSLIEINQTKFNQWEDVTEQIYLKLKERFNLTN